MLVDSKKVAQIDIFETRNYDAFKPLNGQPKHRAAKNAPKLAKEIDSNEGNKIPIIVNSDFKVIDGNTRLEACRMLNAPVRYQIIDSDDSYSLELMRMMNAANQKWTTNNFIEFYAFAYDDYEYKKLSSFIGKNKISVGVIGEFDSRINKEDIEAGNLKKIDYKKLQSRVDMLILLDDSFGDYMKSKLHLARAIRKLYEYGEVDFAELIRKTKLHISDEMKNRKMNKIDGHLTALSIMQSCYNKKMKNKKRIYDDL